MGGPGRDGDFGVAGYVENNLNNTKSGIGNAPFNPHAAGFDPGNGDFAQSHGGNWQHGRGRGRRGGRFQGGRGGCFQPPASDQVRNAKQSVPKHTSVEVIDLLRLQY